MKKIITGWLMVHAVATFSQVTLQANDLNPQVGESYPISRTSWMDAGAGGSNLTWDLSGLAVEASGTLSMLPADANYPGTSHTISISYDDGYTSNAYVESNQNGQWMHGFQFGGSGVTLSFGYNDTQQMLEFPLSMGVTFTDNYSGPFDLAGMSGTRNGTVSYEVDAYGTLTTSYGTFSDVVRVRLERQDQDVTIAGTVNTSTVTYLWYKAGIHYPVAYLTEDLLDPSYNEGGVLGVNELGAMETIFSQVQLFPNPVADHVSVHTGDTELRQIRILTSDGRMVEVMDGPRPEWQIDTGAWPEGIYFLHLVSASGEGAVFRLVK